MQLAGFRKPFSDPVSTSGKRQIAAWYRPGKASGVSPATFQRAVKITITISKPSWGHLV